ncbi:hypothetical protein HPB48_005456 [Haemaphysalis longicornis]|uniref:Reverse transcriptase n=1 Tax=Haemaphysalis longicornis TaxID=44386 RepID=A0A9J6GJ65_HAELO|nr:hypothetical protein HPB48_005456 [Haemaphysalis longicornis]
MKRVPFGATSSPFLLSATIQYHLSKAPEEDKKTAVLKTSFYFDDFLGAAHSKDSVLRIYEQANRIMLKAGMTLKKCRQIPLLCKII